MNRIVKNIPNFITCLNVLCGSVAIIFASAGDELAFGIPSYKLAWLFILLAAVADFSDGFAARALRAYSELGKQLDSLCDAVSFGVAPAILIFFAARSCGAPMWVSWCSLVLPVAAVVRLAKFNIDTRQTESFLGLPVPANAIFWIGYSAMLYDGFYGSHKPVLMVVLMLTMAGLMVSEIPLLALKFKSFGWSANKLRWLLIAGVVLLVAIFRVEGLTWAILYYIVLSSFSRH